MLTGEPILVDDPAILALIAELAAQSDCTDEEAIGIAVSSELAVRQAAKAAREATRAGERTDSGF